MHIISTMALLVVQLQDAGINYYKKLHILFW